MGGQTSEQQNTSETIAKASAVEWPKQWEMKDRKRYGGDGDNKQSNPIQSNFSNIADNFQLFFCLSVFSVFSFFTFELESFAYGLKDTVEDTKNQDKFTPEDRNTVLDAVREIEAFIQTKGETAEKEEYEVKQREEHTERLEWAHLRRPISHSSMHMPVCVCVCFADPIQ